MYFYTSFGYSLPKVKCKVLLNKVEMFQSMHWLTRVKLLLFSWCKVFHNILGAVGILWFHRPHKNPK